MVHEFAEAQRRDRLARLECQLRHGPHNPVRRRRPRGRASQAIAVPADIVFAAITDIAGLPRWNALVDEIVEGPARLAPGAVWDARMRKGAITWVSKSEVTVHDPDTRRFVHLSRTDDGNPSVAEWEWHVTPARGGAIVAVEWRLQPETDLRRIVLAPMRSRMLRREVPASLAAFERYVETRSKAA